MIWTLPNLLTIGRVAIVPVIVALLFMPSEVARWLAAGMFVAAAITDWFDGWLARLRDQTSAFGQFLDPIADKILVISVLIMLVADGTMGQAHVIAALLIVGREILVAGLREFLAGAAVNIPVTFLAKCKTTLQLVATVVLMIAPMTGAVVEATGLVLVWAAAAATVITGWDYMSRGLVHINARERTGAPPSDS